jgi:mRNA interferase MazF
MARDVAWGDVRMVEMGRPDKTRPALVLTRNSALPYLSAVTVAPITRSLRGVPTEIVLGEENGLKITSAANFDNIVTVSKDRLGRYVGSVPASRRREIRNAILFALALDDGEEA